MATGKELRTFTGHTSAVNSVAFAPDGRAVLSGSADKTLKLWDVATGRALRTFTRHTGEVNAVAFAPDGRIALSGSGRVNNTTLKLDDNMLKLWDVATGRTLRNFTGHTGEVRAVAFAVDGRTALSVSGRPDNTLKHWDVATGRELRTFTGHSGPVLCVAIAPDGRTALSGSWDKTLKLWDLTTYLPAAKS